MNIKNITSQNKQLLILNNSKKTYILIIESRIILFSFKKNLSDIEKKISFYLGNSKIIACSNNGVILEIEEKVNNKYIEYLNNNAIDILKITSDNFTFFFINKKDKVKLKYIFLKNKNNLKEDNEIPFISVEEKYILNNFKKIIKRN